MTAGMFPGIKPGMRRSKINRQPKIRIEFCASPDEARIIKSAAAARKLKHTPYVRQAVLERAESDLRTRAA